MTASDKERRLVEFRDTLFVPDLRTNLISVTKITDRDFEVTFHKEGAVVTDRDGRVRLEAIHRGNLYYVRRDEAKLAATKCGNGINVLDILTGEI